MYPRIGTGTITMVHLHGGFTLAGINMSELTNVGTPVAPAMQTSFASREELLAYVTDFSLDLGFAVVIHKSNVPRGQLWLRCDMGGVSRNLVPPTDAKRKRKNSTRLQNCPYQLYGRRLTDSSWVLKVQSELHNHELATDKQDLELHPTARRLTNAQKRLVVEMTDFGIRPAVIVDRLKERFPDKPIKVQDIYNARNHIRKERQAGRVPFPESIEHEAPLLGQENCLPSSVGLSNVLKSVIQLVPSWSSDKQSRFMSEFDELLNKYKGDNQREDTTEPKESNDQEDMRAVTEESASKEMTPSRQDAPAEKESLSTDPETPSNSEQTIEC